MRSPVRSRLKVIACAIAKNEAANVPAWLEATRLADHRRVVDTGSEDATVSMLKAAGVEVQERRYHPFRFDAPRNHLLEDLPSDVWIISPDFDEVFEDGWRAELERQVAAYPDVTQLTYPTLIHDGRNSAPGLNPGCKIHRNVYRWRHPVHEVLTFVGPASERVVHTEGILQHHRQDSRKPRGTLYYHLAEAHLATAPEDEWLLWFACQGAFAIDRDTAKTIAYASRYLALTKPYTNFRAIALVEMARAVARLHGPRDPRVLLSLFRAAAEDPGNTEAWRGLIAAGEAAGDSRLAEFARSRLSPPGPPVDVR